MERLIGYAFILTAAFTAQPVFAQAAPPQTRPDYRSPPRAYKEVTIADRTFVVEKQLLDEAPLTADRALARLNKNIDRALAILPAHSHPHVAKQKFWLLYGPKADGGGLDNGLEYFATGAPQFDPRRDENWSDAIVVYHAENYVDLDDLWALKAVVHELAHAYQLVQWPEKEPNILAAYDKAMAEKLYSNVKNDNGEPLETAYATANQLEYFAELTCMYFARCNYKPFDRAELKAYDPMGYRMIRKMWKIGDEFGARLN